MKTKIIKIDLSVSDWDKQLDEAAEILRSGGLVAFPTETVYGLGANALDEKAVKSIYTAKGRPSDNPLIVHISDYTALDELAGSIPAVTPQLVKEFWPGPLTLVFPRSGKIPAIITAGLDTVAIRMPSHPIALSLIRKAGIPVAAPSANSSGRPSPTLAKHVIEDLSGKVDMIIDGGNSMVGLESTVLDITAEPPVILRPGGVTQEQLRQLLGHVGMDPAITTGQSSAAIPRSPGMKYRHYAPKAPLLLVQGESEQVAAEICRRAELYLGEGTIVGILATDETKSLYDSSMHISCRMLSLGSRLQPEILASNLFKCLREFDEKSVEVILGEIPESNGIGLALVNRLMKAAGGNIIKV